MFFLEGEDGPASGLEGAELGQGRRQDHLGIEAGGDQLGLEEGRIAVPFGHWRVGCTLVGISVTLGGLLRLLPHQRVGLLAVRNRVIDTILLLGSGLGILLLSWIVPPTAH